MYIKKILLAIAILGLVGIGIFSYIIYTTIFSSNTTFESTTESVYIKTDATYKEVVNQLQPLLKDVEGFDAVAHRKGYLNAVKPGRYILEKGMNNNQIINTLRSQNTPVEVVFNNQERLEELAGRIANQIEADSVTLLKTMTDSVFLAQQKLDRSTALAMYVPNKYQFYWNTSAEEFRDRMLKEYKRFWNKERNQRAKEIGLTPTEVCVLASIVQKETSKVDERKKIAGVYMNRYKRGIKLDADPTVIYAVKKQRKNFDTIIKRVLYKDLEIDSPYNTYKYAGLPPGLISMPDISSVEAVLYHESHDYYYFVADVQNPGYHKFASSLRQHNNNRQEYVRWINKMNIRR